MSVSLDSPLLQTKLHVPASSRPPLQRPSVDRLLDSGCATGLILVSAPAGFGKTTAVAEWVNRSPRDVAWVSLDRHDRDPSRLLLYIVEAIRLCGYPALEEVAVGLHSGLFDAETAATVLLNSLTALRAELVLVLDDLQVLEDGASCELLRFLIERAPGSLRPLLISRAEPTLPLSRLRAHGRLTEIRGPDLRFSRHEIAAFMLEATGTELPAALLDELAMRSEGWAVGLQMVALGLQNCSDPVALVSNFSGRHRIVLEYLLDEVLAHFDDDQRAQLLSLSIVDVLDPELVEAVAGTDHGCAFLGALEARNLFLTVVDRERSRFRFHPLFRELLQHEFEQKFGRDQQAATHVRAATVLKARGQGSVALEHFISGCAWDEAEAHWLEVSMAGLLTANVGASFAALERFPQAVVHQRARLAVRKLSLGQVLGFRCEHLRELLIQAEASVAQRPDLQASAELGLRRVLLDGWNEHAANQLDLAAKQLQNEPGPLAAMVDINRAQLAMREDRFEDALSAVESMTLAVAHSPDPWPRYWARWYGGLVRLVRGYTFDATAAIEQLWAEASRNRSESLPPAAALGLATLAHARLEAGQFERASEALDEALALADPKMTGLDAIEVVLTAAWLEALRDPTSGAWRKALARARSLAHAVAAKDALQRIDLLEVRIQLDARLGSRTEPALRRFLERSSFCEPPRSKVFPTTRPDLERALRARARVRLQVEMGGVLPEVTALIERADVADRRICRVDARLTAVELAIRCDHRATRDRWLAEAITIAADHDIMAPWYPAPAEICELAGPLAARIGCGVFAAKLAEISTAGPTEAVSVNPAELVESLSSREIEVLGWLDQGLSNAEIARALCVAPSTIKSHVSRIYRKLSVRRRTQAVARGRALGLL